MNPAKQFSHIFSPGKDGFDNVKSQGILTFMRTPTCKLETQALIDAGVHYAFVGVPYDEGNIGKPGCSDGPHALREASTQYFPYMFEYGVDLYECCPMVDCGDVAIIGSNPKRSYERIYDAVTSILKADVVPILCGGDHSVAIPASHALSDHLGTGDMGYLHCGSHLDMADTWAGERNTSVSAMARATELPNLDIANVAHIGARNGLNPKDFFDLAEERNLRYFAMWEVLERGIEAVSEEAADRVWAGTAGQYVTFDLNVVDAASAPGVTAPEPGGLDGREAIAMARTLGKHKSASVIEISELSPIYDINMITSKLGICLVDHFLASISQSRGCKVDPSVTREKYV